MDLKLSLSELAGIGPAYAKRCEKLGIITIEDLICHYPFRYDDFSKISKIFDAKIGDITTFRGEVWSIKNTYTRFRKVLTKTVLNDGSGSIDIVWFNQPWITKNIEVGDNLQVSGKVEKYNSKISLVSPEWEKIYDSLKNTVHTGRLIPVYPETYRLSSKWLRNKIFQLLPQVLHQISDPLPLSFKGKMISLEKALEQIHFPASQKLLEQAQERLSFDELLFIQLATLKKRLDWQEKQSVKPFQINQKKLSTFIQNLPFKLTPSQIKVVQEIVQDLKLDHPMNRLLQGEVGSGKTVVAAITIYLSYLNNLRSVLMAPTEILAFQHYETLSKLFAPLGITVGIYTGSKKFTPPIITGDETTKQSSSSTKQIASIRSNIGPRNDKITPNIIIGTHALLSDKLKFEDTGLVVIDEQQRFGVEQRSLLRAQARSPHFLTMTATPIPRTVALTLYGDLDLSIIDQLPLGRKIVRTYFVPAHRRNDAYGFIGKHIAQGFQTYIITPLIEQSETQATVRAAKIEFERLQKDVFINFRLGLLHGRLKSKEKESVINDFRDHRIDILVSTSVVEVGMDIPNATIMVIEGAEKFGLAQLHQLRGRVGRSETQSFAFLFTDQENPQAIKRLKKLERIHDGLELAELDLKIRGSGEVFGTKQSGRWNLKIASLSNLHLVEKTREMANKILETSPSLDKYPKIKAQLSSLTLEIMPD